MKKAVKRVSITAGIILLIMVALHLALFAFVNVKGRELIVGGVKKSLGIDASMESLSLKFPFNLEIRNFKCDTLSFKRANASLSFFNPLTRHLSLNKVYLDGLNLKLAEDKGGIALSRPSQEKSRNQEKLVLTRDALGFDNSVAASGSPEETAKPEKKKAPVPSRKEEPQTNKKKFSLAVGNIYLKNSRMEVTYPLNKRPFSIIFDNISLRIKGFAYPRLSRFYLKLNTGLVSPDQESNTANILKVKGWVDSERKNMDVDIEIVDFDYPSFGKYYPPFWRPHNLGLKEAVASFESNLNSRDNILTIDNLLTIEKVEFVEEESEEKDSFKAKALKTIFSYLKGDKEKPTLHFKLITRMDSPKLDFSSFKDTLLKTAGIGPLGVVKGIVDEVKTKIGGVKDVAVGGVVETIKGTAGTIKEIIKGSNGKDQIQEEPAPQVDNN